MKKLTLIKVLEEVVFWHRQTGISKTFRSGHNSSHDHDLYDPKLSPSYALVLTQQEEVKNMTKGFFISVSFSV